MLFLGGAWNFVKRHRRKIVVVGVVLGGVALLKRYTEHKLREWAESETANCLDRLKREQHFDSTRRTCMTTVSNLMVNLNDNVLLVIDCESLTDLLKNRPSNRLEIWDCLKHMAFTRVVVDVYSSTLLVTLLNIQLNIIGGYMFVDAVAFTSNNSTHQELRKPMLNQAVQEKYLSLVRRFLENGIPELAQLVKGAVRIVIGDMSLKEEVTIGKIQELLTSIQCVLEKGVIGTNKPTSTNFITEYVASLLKATGFDYLGTDQILAKIIDETVDIIESEDCKTVFHQTVRAGFSVTADALVECFASVKTPKMQTSTSSMNDTEIVIFANPNEVSMPIAKIIPMLTSLSRRLLIGQLSEQLLTAMFGVQAQQVLAANIYESFSQSHANTGQSGH